MPRSEADADACEKIYDPSEIIPIGKGGLAVEVVSDECSSSAKMDENPELYTVAWKTGRSMTVGSVGLSPQVIEYFIRRTMKCSQVFEESPFPLLRVSWCARYCLIGPER
jgi:hypothetical protein